MQLPILFCHLGVLCCWDEENITMSHYRTQTSTFLWASTTPLLLQKLTDPNPFFSQSKRNVKSKPRPRLFEGNITAKYSLLASMPPDIHQALRVLLTVVNSGWLPCSHLLLNIITIQRKYNQAVECTLLPGNLMPCWGFILLWNKKHLQPEPIIDPGPHKNSLRVSTSMANMQLRRISWEMYVWVTKLPSPFSVQLWEGFCNWNHWWII